MKKSAIILAGGFSKRFGPDKGLIELAGKALILHVYNQATKVVNEVVVVVSSHEQKRTYASLLGHRARIFIDKEERRSPLVGASTGWEKARGEYTLLLPCDTPFIAPEIAKLLLDLCVNKNAVIPRWPNGYIEPLQASYRTKPALDATRKALEQGKLDLRSMLVHIKGVRYISTMTLQRLDPELLTFFNINTVQDLKKASFLLKQKCL